MIEIRKTEVFTNWFNGLKDRRAKARVQARIDRLKFGHFGDVAPVGEGVRELRIFYGPGYRVYETDRGIRPPLNLSVRLQNIKTLKTIYILQEVSYERRSSVQS